MDRKLNATILYITVLFLLITCMTCRSIKMKDVDVLRVKNNTSEKNYRLIRSLRSSIRVQGFCSIGYVYLEGFGCRKIFRRNG